MVKVAEPIWLGVGAALLVLTAYSLAIMPNVHEPIMLLTIAVCLGVLGLAAIATGTWLSRWPRRGAALASSLLDTSVVAALWLFMIYMGSSLSGPY